MHHAKLFEPRSDTLWKLDDQVSSRYNTSLIPMKINFFSTVCTVSLQLEQESCLMCSFYISPIFISSIFYMYFASQGCVYSHDFLTTVHWLTNPSLLSIIMSLLWWLLQHGKPKTSPLTLYLPWLPNGTYRFYSLTVHQTILLVSGEPRGKGR